MYNVNYKLDGQSLSIRCGSADEANEQRRRFEKYARVVDVEVKFTEDVPDLPERLIDDGDVI